MNQSTDSVFNASASSEHPAVHATLCHLFAAVSPAFAQWYQKRVQEGDQLEKFSLEEVLDTLPTLASSTVPAQHWFASAQESGDSVELLHHASQILTDESIPFLSADVTSAPNWLAEYGLIKEQFDAQIQPYYTYSLENEFAAAAVRGARRIVDGGRVVEE